MTAYVFDPGGKFREQIDADRGHYEPGAWRLENATVTAPNATPRKVAIYNLPTNLSADEVKRTFLQLDSVSFWELPSLAASAQRAGVPDNRFLLQYNVLLSRPILLLAMVLIAANVSLRFSRSRDVGWMIIAGVGVGFMLYVLMKIAWDLGSGGIVPPPLAAWLPAGVATLVWNNGSVASGGWMIGAATRVAAGGWSGRIFGRGLMRVALAAVLLGFAVPSVGLAAVGDSMGRYARPSVAPGERMLVESDQLVYDYDHNAVSAVGNVKIYYAGYTLEAEKVTYNKTSGRLFASGHVKLVDPTGSAYYSDYLDITDDFRDGFVQSLRVDSADHTHFGAASAQHGADKTTFTDGSYTACEPCKDHPEKPPLWDVKAAKIVFDHKEHMVYFTNARFEFMGVPLAWAPYFSVPDPTVKRKSGFLAPNFGYAEKLGFYGSLPYYWVIAPNMDVTFTPTYLTRQGFLGQVEFRHRLSNGQYAVRVAGISQSDPDAFSGSSGTTNLRGAISTTGQINLAQDWTLGWDGTLLSDRTFTRDYGVINGDVCGDDLDHHLTGLRDRNYFEARASDLPGPHHVEPTATLRSGPPGDRGAGDRQQEIRRPPGVRRRAVVHLQPDGAHPQRGRLRGSTDAAAPAGPTYSRGTAGNFVRATEQVDWQRRFIGPMGQVITPFAYLRGDAFYLNGQTAAADGRRADVRFQRLSLHAGRRRRLEPADPGADGPCHQHHRAARPVDRAARTR